MGEDNSSTYNQQRICIKNIYFKNQESKKFKAIYRKLG